MSNKNIIVNHALEICVNIYKTTEKKVLDNNCRKRNTIKAKRMFIYYLYKDLNINYLAINKYFNKLHHATSIHHVNKFEFEVNNYKEIKVDYNNFLNKMKTFKLSGKKLNDRIIKLTKLIEEINKIKL